jgi:hypothetical protein
MTGSERDWVLARNKRDFIGGILLVFFGAGALFMARNYTIGTAFRMGPGYFPVILASLLIVIGMIVICTSVKSDEVKLPHFAWRPFIIVSVAVALFGVIIDRAGLALSTFAMVLVSRLARPGYPWVETIVLGVALSALCAGIFFFGLKIQVPLLPTWWG